MKLSIDQVAKYLNLPPSTLARWIRQGRIPIQKSGDSCNFNRTTLEKWARQRGLYFGVPEESAACAEDSCHETLLTAMKRGGVVHRLRADTAETALKAGVQRLPLLTPEERDVLFERLVERENLTSTGIGKGVAIPHPRTPLDGCDHPAMISTCFLASPLDFRAIDDLPVFVLFIILCPSVKLHLHLLSRLAFCLRDPEFQTLLKSQPSAEILLEKVRGIEKSLENSSGF